jgi:hypothetical protein
MSLTLCIPQTRSGTADIIHKITRYLGVRVRLRIRIRMDLNYFGRLDPDPEFGSNVQCRVYSRADANVQFL